MATYIIQAYDHRPDPIGGPHGDPYVEQTRAAADERAAELANMLNRSLSPELKKAYHVSIHEEDGGMIRTVAALSIV